MREKVAKSAKSSRWRRWRVLVYLLLGLTAVDVVVRLNSGRWRRYDPDDYRERLDACRAGDWDLVLVGGSTVADGLDPRALRGLDWWGQPLDRVFNLGLCGATSSEVWHAVAHGLRRPPRLLVYGITASDLNDSRLEPHGPHELMTAGDVVHWARHHPRRQATWACRHFLRGRLARFWGLYHHRNGIRLWAAERLEALWPGACPESAAEARRGVYESQAIRTAAGFSPNPGFQSLRLDQIKAAGWRPTFFPFLDHYRLGGHLEYLHRLLDWARGQGVAVVLLDMPVSADLERLHAEAFAAYRAALARLERDRRVVVLRPTRGTVGLTDADFADLIHLNQSGVTRLSTWLRGRLAVLGEPGNEA